LVIAQVADRHPDADTALRPGLSLKQHSKPYPGSAPTPAHLGSARAFDLPPQRLHASCGGWEPGDPFFSCGNAADRAARRRPHRKSGRSTAKLAPQRQSCLGGEKTAAANSILPRPHHA